MHEDDHYIDGLDHPDDGGVLGGRVKAVKSSAEGILPHNSVGSKQSGPSGDTQDQVDYLKGKNTDDIHLEVSIFDIILGALFSVCLVNATSIQEHDSWLDQKYVTPVNGITDIVAYQPVQSVGLKNKVLAKTN